MLRKNTLHSCWSVLIVLVLTTASHATAQSLINRSFEDPRQTAGTPAVSFVLGSAMPGWETTATDDQIEVWSDNFLGVPAFDFDQHVELNAFQVSTLFQDLAGVGAGNLASFRFAHRGRSGVDTIRLTITDLGLDGVPGGGDDNVLFTQDYATDNTAWVEYTSEFESPIVTLGNTMRIAFESVSSAGGNQAIGNFLDAIDFGIGVAPTPAPPAAIPTVSEWGMILLSLLLAGGGVFFLRQRMG